MIGLERKLFQAKQQEHKIETRTGARDFAVVTILAAVALLSTLGGVVIHAQGQDNDKYALKSPDGIAFSHFRGYED